MDEYTADQQMYVATCHILQGTQDIIFGSHFIFRTTFEASQAEKNPDWTNVTQWALKLGMGIAAGTHEASLSNSIKVSIP